jgi:type I restriction enzyme S subunit
VTESRHTVAPAELDDDAAFLYSIPVLDELGDGALESVGDIGSDKLLLRGGEVLVSKLNPRISRVLIARPHSVPTLASTEFIALSPGDRLDPRFLGYWLQTETTRQRLDGATMSVTRSHQRIRPDVLTRTWLDLPDVPLQQAIADHLDREIERLDALIAAQERLVSLLVERLQSLASRLTHAPAAESDGYAIPPGWSRLSLRRCLSSSRYGIGESAQASGEYAVLGMRNVRSGEVVGEPSGFVSEVDETLLLDPGDLLFNRTNSRELVGKVGIVRSLEQPTTFASYLVRLRTNRFASAGYLNYLLNSREVLGLARSMALPSIGQANLNPSRYTTIVLPMPPLAEQDRITSRLDAIARRTGDASQALEKQVELLKERRQALITSAVTGQIDIPEAT